MPTTFITVDELRVAVGRASKDPSEAAPFSDPELQAIIDRHKANAEQMIEARVEKRMVEQGPVAGDDLFAKETVSMTPSGPFATGTIDDTTYYPITSQTAWDGSDSVLTYDRSLDSQVPVFFTRRRYRLIGNEVHVIPKDVSSITLYLPKRAETNARVGADLVRDANQRIIQEARSTMGIQVQEGSRLEGTDYYGSDRDQ